MAQYTINAGCGHRVTQQLYGVERDRRRRIEWMESPSGMCNPCYAAHKTVQSQMERKARDAAAAASMARTITSEKLLAQAKAMARQAEILNHPKAKILAMALTLYSQANWE